jgi:hypothetical protein
LTAAHHDPHPTDWIHPDLVTSNAAAKMLGISPKKLGALIRKAGIQPHAQRSSNYRYWDLPLLVEQLEAYRRENPFRHE